MQYMTCSGGINGDGENKYKNHLIYLLTKYTRSIIWRVKYACPVYT